MIEVVATGALNTVQDLGRKGLRRFGITTSGAMDELALRIGNLLVGNDEDAAGIEIQTFPFKVQFASNTQIAITGASAKETRLDMKRLPAWWGCRARAGDTLVVTQPTRGARTYLTFAGGVDVPVVLGSRSTHLGNSFGGFDGRPLRVGDQLQLGEAAGAEMPDFGVLPPDIAITGVPERNLSVRAIPGADYDDFPDDARRALWNTEWIITAQSDRAGYRLRGQPLIRSNPVELRSYGIVAGIIQVPPSGLPIIQLSDANTAGGYARIAGVIEADLWRLAQVPLGASIRFVETDYASAIEALSPIAAYLESVRDTAGAVRRMMSPLKAVR